MQLVPVSQKFLHSKIFFYNGYSISSTCIAVSIQILNRNLTFWNLECIKKDVSIV